MDITFTSVTRIRPEPAAGKGPTSRSPRWPLPSRGASANLWAMADGSASGHRSLPHVADVVLEAWAPTRIGCLEAAVLGLVDLFADAQGRSPTEWVPVAVAADRDDDLLVRLLEEVLFQVDAAGRVPVAVRLEVAAGAEVRGELGTVPVEGVAETGAVPKGVSRSEVVFGPTDHEWRARVVVDV